MTAPVDNNDELIQSLVHLGFSIYGAKIYIALVKESPATAYRISRISGVPHAKVYENVRRLTDEGFVQVVGTDPEMYAPLPPSQLVSHMRARYDKTISCTEKGLASLPANIEIEPVYTIHDPAAAILRALEIIEGAKEKLFVGLWDSELEILEPALRAANNRGVWTAALIYGSRELDFGIWFHHSTHGLEKMHEVSGRNLDIVTDTTVALAGSLGAAEPCRIVWTYNMGLVRELESLFAHDLYIAEIESVLGHEFIREHFGDNLRNLRKKYLQLDD